MVTPIRLDDAILTLRTDAGNGRDFLRCSLLIFESCQLLIAEIELCAGQALVPWILMVSTCLELAKVADHHGIFVFMNLTTAAIGSETHHVGIWL